MGGQIDVFFMTYGSAQDYIASGDIVPLGVFSEERTDAAPDVPTFREQGLDLVFEKFFFYAFPKDTPAEIVEKFNSAVEKVVALPECQEDISQFCTDTGVCEPAGYPDLFRRDVRFLQQIRRNVLKI